MKRRLVVTCSLVLVLAAGIAVPAAEETSREDALARELLELTGGGDMAVEMMRSMIDSLPAAQPGLSREVLEEVIAELDPGELEDLVVPVYARHFTADEMEAAIAFYRTPAGQSMLRKMPLVMQETMRVGMEWQGDFARRVMERMDERRSASPPGDPE